MNVVLEGAHDAITCAAIAAFHEYVLHGPEVIKKDGLKTGEPFDSNRKRTETVLGPLAQEVRALHNALPSHNFYE